MNDSPRAPLELRPAAAGWALAALAMITTVGLLYIPPIHQDVAYHHFAGRQTWLGIPNAANVLSNLPFLMVAIYGLGVLLRGVVFLSSWELYAHVLLVAGTAAVSVGSAYYHWAPDAGTLFWDRLPMTLVFMSLFAITIGERLSPAAVRRLLAPLLGVGLLSVIVWRVTGDLRLYGAVQFLPMAALPFLYLTRPPRYTGQGGLWAMIAFYVLAKVVELFDAPLAAWLPEGGHPWKHVAAALALAVYFATVARREVIRQSAVPPPSAPVFPARPRAPRPETA